MLVCLLSISWSCREQCTGKTAHYGKSEGGKWQKGGGIFDEAPGVSLMRSNVRELRLSFTANRTVRQCYNEAKDITNGCN